MAAEFATVYLGALQCRGSWDGIEPFFADSGPRTLPEPIGIITRATIRKRIALRFWRHVPDVSTELAGHPSVLFKLGMGEVPWFQQVTFSIWTSAKDMYEFAYQNSAHARAVAKVRDEVWFKEDLFARFQILDWEGTWYGERPVQGNNLVLSDELRNDG